MKKLFALFLLSALFFSAASAQASIDPTDDFYEAALRWYIGGVISELPQLKPYPHDTVRRLLFTVMEKGDREQEAEAREYYESMFGKTWHISAETESTGIVRRNGTTKENGADGSLSLSLEGGADVLFGKGFGAGGRACLSSSLSSDENNTVRELWSIPSYDNAIDPVSLGRVRIDFSADAVVSYEKIGVSAGYNRTGYTNYIDGGNVLSPYAYHAPEFSFSYDGERFDFVQYFAALRASDMLGKNGPYGKFISFHALRFSPNRKIRLSYYDSVVYGKRFDPSYLISVPSALIASANGYGDNVIAGFLFEYNFFPGVSWLTDVSIDRLDTAQLARFHLNSDNRLALKTGLSYAPKDSPCKLLTFSYTIISPYMYTSEDTNGESYNYHSYTNWGRSIGQNLPPNSDRLSLKIKLEPIKRFSVSTFASITRHANVYQSYSNEELKEIFSKGKHSTDGSIDSQYHKATPLLSQEHIMYAARGGAEVSYRFPCVKAGLFELHGIFSYTYIGNAGMDTPMYPDATAASNFDALRNAWKNQLHEEYDIFLSIGIKWTY